MSKMTKKEMKELIKHLMEKTEASTEKDVDTTHGLVTKSINMKLAEGIAEARKEGDCALMSDKAIELGIKWCVTNGTKFKTSKEAADYEQNLLDEIASRQRDRVGKKPTVN